MAFAVSSTFIVPPQPTASMTAYIFGLRVADLLAGDFEPVGDLAHTRVGRTVTRECSNFRRVAEGDQRGANRVGLGRRCEGQQYDRMPKGS
jgi:hypothetical protein